MKSIKLLFAIIYLNNSAINFITIEHYIILCLSIYYNLIPSINNIHKYVYLCNVSLSLFLELIHFIFGNY